MEYVVFIAMVAVFILAVTVQSLLARRKFRKNFIAGIRRDYGKLSDEGIKPERWETIPAYFEKHRTGFFIDDITWNDLNMDEIFSRMNRTYSAAGEEYLYYALRTPSFSPEELAQREKKIVYFMEHEDTRLDVQTILADLGKTGKYSIYNYLDYLSRLGRRSNIRHYIGDLLILAALCVTFVYVPVGILFLTAAICANFISYFKVKAQIDPYITSFAYIIRLLDCAQRLERLDVAGTDISDEMGELKLLRKRFGSFLKGSYLLMSPARMSSSGNPLEILMDYVRMGFHLDLIKFNQMLAEVRKHTADVDRMLTLFGFLETLIVVGSYRASLADWCIPELSVGRSSLLGEGMYHPLIEKPVKNSIRASRGVLLTGSNASGKSTFLKTVAVNALFAQTIHTCLADRYESGIFRLYSSMALRDDLSGGNSYYMVEIQALKRILDGVRQKESPILCFVDEVLRGTNTVERIAASTQLLLNLAGRGVHCFAATHDVELTQLLERQYDNYHFEEEILSGDVVFNYRLHKGRATTRNAIKLLEVMGYDSDIVRAAERMAEQFLRSGIWKEESR